jgi:GAF domain-containing protein
VLCAESIATAEPMVVDDVRADPRFALHPALEADPHLRFYCGAAARARRLLAVGALCVSDRKPRVLRPAQLAALQRVARQIVRLVSFRGTRRRWPRRTRRWRSARRSTACWPTPRPTRS